ncbi:uncharacterized protein LOC116343233 [Contarinia nasturtii]|uniref:uncharacterized protein LOC116343233 n=1 Tax=Contarinia nasturtii TaxID=265458 RepID=UPI0012D42CB5|nr:uncharacterized protein LOC116343233 [Contarinia nasturtii]
MPIKAHVKGKRKAPPPPQQTLPPPSPPPSSSSMLIPLGKLEASTSNVQSSINQSENKFPNENAGKTPETMTCFSTTHQKRKKPAPLPPSAGNHSTLIVNKKNHATGIEMNNLSAISKRKVGDKTAVKAINLNIFEPNNIRNQLQCPTKETNEVNVNMDSNRRHDIFNNELFARQQRNEYQIWICNYCTLQNPFWKIVCDACERIKPYNTPTISNIQMSFATNVDNDSVRMNGKNLMSSVMLRPKIIKPNNDGDKILNRNSMNVDIKSASSSKQLPNKRNSLCLFKYGDQNISPEALEIEKERIRAVIRAMNNRALAQKKFPEKIIEHRTDDDDDNDNNVKNDTAATKIATINKPTIRRNGLLKYDNQKDYNLPSVRKHVSGECSTMANDFKTNANEAKPIRKIENTDSMAKCKELVENIQTYCDEVSLANTRKHLKHDTNEKRKSHITATKNSFKTGIDNNILLNLYINFNNAIEVKIKHDMTLDEFKTYIFDKLMACKNPKIYFNGLLLKNGEQKLAQYGVTNQSSLYINTENVVVQAHAKTEGKSVIVQTEDSELLKNEMKNVKPDEKRVEKVNKEKDKNGTNTQLDVNAGKNGEKFLIEHVTLNRYLIERLPPQDALPQNGNKVKYRGVYNYNPRVNPDIQKILNEKPAKPVKIPITHTKPSSLKSVADKELDSMIEITKKSEPITQYIELLSLDDSMDLTTNTSVFECPVCFVDYEPFEGVILRNCLHTFCKDCIRNTIIYSDDAEVKCPFIDNQYSCDCLLQDREIKALLSKSEYDEHLAKSLRIAENQIENSFHCKTPDCKGWCIYEDDVNAFKCPICRLENCLTCRVIHDGLDCKQYQNMMENNVESNPENATTHAMLQEMIEKGEAMNCPACKIVLMKKWGCDWLKCSMCKTEICWITRSYRWGPGGKGDTSGGCKCGVDGFRCHPKCNYCH